MTSALAPSTTGTVPTAVVVARVHAVLDDVGESEIGEVSGRDVAEVERGIARMEALKLRMVASAHRQGAARRSGMSGTSAWLAAHTRAWGGKAAADVVLATALHDSLPLTRRALATGALSTAHAAVIAETTRRLPAVLTDRERLKVESALVAHARHVDPGRLRRSARRALLAAERSAQESLEHEDGELRSEESRAAARVRLTMHDNLDGTVTGHFTVPTLAGAILRKAIQQMVSPRRRRDADQPRQQGVVEHTRRSLDGQTSGHVDGETSGRVDGHSTGRVDGHSNERVDGQTNGRVDGHSNGQVDGQTSGRVDGQASGRVDGHTRGTDGRADDPDAGWRGAPGGLPDGCSWREDWAGLQGAAFAELLEHLPTDRLHGKVAATVVVTVDHQHLRDALGAAHLDTGNDLSAAEARRLACSAGILPAVLDGTSLPLDLGRTKRFFTEAQRVALATTYDECAAQGCDRPFAWCDLHHEDPWSRGGATDLGLAVPLCGFHHRLAHDPRQEPQVHTAADGRKGVGFRRRGG